MNRDESAVYLCALRYALGRRTYIPSIISEQLIDKWISISETDKRLIVAEIKRAIHINEAGDDCDVVNWEKVISHDAVHAKGEQ